MTVAENRYSPLYFLASLGAGGLTVTFFMWLMFWVPHTGRPVPIFEDAWPLLTGGTLMQQAMILVAWAGIAIFGFLNLKLLAFNLRRFAEFRRSDAYETFARSNAGSQVLAMPLALAMSVNAMFILGLTFVPGLWNIVEYLFPAALAAFLAIGWIAFRELGHFIKERLHSGGFDCSANNSFAQMLPAFALAMIGVGLAAPAAMSGATLTVGVSLVLSTFFITTAIILALIVLVMSMRSMLEHGVNVEAAPTLMVVIPLMTVIGIALLRQNHGLHTTFEAHGTAADTLMLLTRLLSVEVIFALFGLAVLSRVGYVARFVTGSETSAGSYALVCPGVALSVMTHFWLNKGLVAAGIVAKYSVAYWAISGIAVALQLGMIVLVWMLARKHFAPAPKGAVPA
ncbi:TsoY family (seleno)protein [Nioella sp.]|uniref:TsoY family (seleno)protein n=1 Tax=Nioella sp. TaxID=1912091 RepID=UPI003B52164D